MVCGVFVVILCKKDSLDVVSRFPLNAAQWQLLLQIL